MFIKCINIRYVIFWRNIVSFKITPKYDLHPSPRAIHNTDNELSSLGIWNM